MRFRWSFYLVIPKDCDTTIRVGASELYEKELDAEVEG